METYIAGFSSLLPFAENSNALIDHLKIGKCLSDTYWFKSDQEAIKQGFNSNKLVARLHHDEKNRLNLVSDLVMQSLNQAGLSENHLSGDNVRVYLTGLGPRVDVIDYMLFYDHNDIEDVKLTKSVQKLHVSNNASQDRLSHEIAARFNLKYLPPNLHCTSNSSLAAVHMGIQAIKSGVIDLVLVINCSEIKTQDINFLQSQSMLDSDIIQPFGEESKGVLFSEGFSSMLLESHQHRQARQLQSGIELVSNYLQTSSGRSNDATQFSSSLLKVINKTLVQANITCDDLCAVIPHANGSEATDKVEAQALKVLLSDTQIPLLAYKGQLGYNATGSGIIDLIIGYHSLSQHELLSPIGHSKIRENIASHVLRNQGVVPHDRTHLLKVGLGVDGSAISIVMSNKNIKQ